MPESKLANCLEELRRAGCEISEPESGRLLISRSGCGVMLQQAADGSIQFAVRPGMLFRGEIAHLTDRGFQKFWQHGERSIPARAEELLALHEFERDLHAALGVTTLYNQALGTVSSKYIYDRVEGREPGKRHPSFD